jgi:spore coat polysaccharide biosynthesis predicted glycosyltransferase SpsG
MSTPLLVARLQATDRTGAGHAMRCLGVLERWGQAGGRAELWGAVEIDFVRRRADNAGIPIVATPGDDVSVLVVDVYDAVEREELGRWSAAAIRVLVDDFGEDIPTGYSVVWNPNAYADASLYCGFVGHIFAGRKYVPVREGLPAWVGGGEGAVSFGGIRIEERLNTVLEALPAACGVSRLQCVGSPLPACCRPVPPDDIWRALKHAPWLISAAGSTTWEAAVVGIPFVAVIIADNHMVAARWIAGHGVPVVDLRLRESPEEAVSTLSLAVTRARPLPKLQPGGGAVVQELSSLIGWSP